MVERMLVVGASGYVGRRVVAEALRRGVAVAALSRSGKPNILRQDDTLHQATWLRADATQAETLAPHLDKIDAVVSALGTFGSNATMRAVNGDANAALAAAAAAGGVRRFVHVSAADYGPLEKLLPGYFEGKRIADAAVAEHFGERGTSLRPGFIHGTRAVALPLVGGEVQLPLWLAGAPMEYLFSSVAGRAACRALGSLGGVLTPPVSVDAVATAAVNAALGDGGQPLETLDDAPETSEPRLRELKLNVWGWAEMARQREAALARSTGVAAANDDPVVTLFWDGGCPLCKREIAYYRGLDTAHRVHWVNIDEEPGASMLPAGVSRAQAMQRIHAIDRNGEILAGVPAFLAVWEQLPYWRRLPPLLRAVPAALPLADSAYSFFARHRMRLTGRAAALSDDAASCAAADATEGDCKRAKSE